MPTTKLPITCPPETVQLGLDRREGIFDERVHVLSESEKWPPETVTDVPAGPVTGVSSMYGPDALLTPFETTMGTRTMISS